MPEPSARQGALLNTLHMYCIRCTSQTTHCNRCMSQTTHCNWCTSQTTHYIRCTSQTTHCIRCTSQTTHCNRCMSQTTHCNWCTSQTTHYIRCTSQTTHCIRCTSQTTHCIRCNHKLHTVLGVHRKLYTHTDIGDIMANVKTKTTLITIIHRYHIICMYTPSNIFVKVQCTTNHA